MELRRAHDALIRGDRPAAIAALRIAKSLLTTCARSDERVYLASDHWGGL